MARTSARIAAAAVVPALGAAYLFFFLHAESEQAVGALLVLGVAAGIGLTLRPPAPLLRAAGGAGQATALWTAAAVILLGVLFRDDAFSLFLLARVLVIVIACLGLHLQFGAAGITNFAGAAFFGIGGYTAAVVGRSGAVPGLLVLLLGGAAAAAIGSVLILPVLRTRGHYAALVTVAFGLLFRTFLEVNDTLGGPQGLKLKGLVLFGWNLGDDLVLGGFTASFLLNYVFAALVLLAFAFMVALRVERSFVGLALDAIRLDETAAAAFGLDVARWKILAFTLGNFLTGLAGALSSYLVGFIAPNNYTFGESLIMVSIVLLGGIGNTFGLPLAAAIVILLPEKLQLIQEYRYLLYAVLVMAVLLFRPAGLVPRRLRRWPDGVAAPPSSANASPAANAAPSGAP
jgi:ABC-type branched-subunit amino acid transport system permease subunit